MAEWWPRLKAGLKGFVAGVIAILAALFGLKIIAGLKCKGDTPDIKTPEEAKEKTSAKILADDPQHVADTYLDEATRRRIDDAKRDGMDGVMGGPPVRDPNYHKP